MKDFLHNFFDTKTVACVVCNNRRYQKDCPLKNEFFGICKNCMKGITLSQRGSSFEGSRHVLYTLSPLIYEDGAREMIRSLKFHHNTAVAKLFGEIFRDFLSEYDHLSDFDMVVPVPLSKQRMMERGYNQAELIAEFVSDFCYLPLSKPVTRIKHTKRQAGLSAQKRFYNVKDAFLSDESVNGKRIILVDDVRTTGNTMDNCAKAMIEKGAAEVIGITATISVARKTITY